MSRARQSVTLAMTELDTTRLAMDAGQVLEILDREPAEGAAVIDLAELLGLPATEGRRRVVRLGGGTDERLLRLGGRVDLVEVSLGRLRPAPPLLATGLERKGVVGFVSEENALWILLDVERIRNMQRQEGGEG